MPIDPNIPLAAGQPSGPFGPDLRSILTQYQLAQRMQLIQEEQNQQNALKNVFSQAGNLDPNTGYLSPQGRNALAQVAPGQYLDYLGKAATAQERGVRSEMLQSELHKSFVEDQKKALATAVNTYDETTKKYGPEKGLEAYNKFLNDNWESARASGYSQWTADRPVIPDIAHARIAVMAQQAADAKPVSPLEAAKLGLEQQRVGMEGEKVDIEKQKLKLQQRKAADYGPSEDFEYTTPEGKRVPVSLRESKDPSQPPITSTGEAFALPPGATGLKRTGLGADREPAFYRGSTTDAEGKRTETTAQFKDGNWVRPGTSEVIPNFNVEGKLGATGPTASPEALAATARAIGRYEQAPLSSYSLSRGNGPEIERILKEEYPEYNAQKYQVAQRIRTDFAVGARSAKQMDAMNTVVHHLFVFDDLGKALKNRDPNSINAVINYVRTQLGHPEVTSFDTAKGLVADEIVNAVTGSGAVFDREGMQSNLKSARSPEQLEGQANTIRRLMAGRLGSLYQRWQSAPGMPADEFLAKLEPETIEGIRGYETSNLKKALGEARKAEGGLEISKIYDGPGGSKLRYLGGPTNDASSWEMTHPGEAQPSAQ